MKFYKKTALLLIIVLLLTMCMITFVGCNDKPEKKAMILIPGIMGSALYDIDSDIAVWSLSDVKKFLIETPNLGEYVQDLFSFDDNQEPIKKMRPATMEDEEDKFTMLNFLENLYYLLEENYSEEYDVIIWQYDWRYNNNYSASKLESFINDNEYTNVMLFTHSMGGNVVTKYLQKAENREKVDLFMPFSAPFLGALEATHVVFQGYSSGAVSENPGSLDTILKKASESINGQKFISNFGTIYELLPYNEINDTYLYENASYLSKDNANADTTVLIDIIKSLEWSKNTKGEIKPMIKDLLVKQSEDFVEKDGKIVHVSELVNTEYICGRGKDTLSKINYDSENDILLPEEKSTEGDGTVLICSAIAGLSLDDPRVHIVDNKGHGEIVTSEESMELAKNILIEYIGY